MFDSRNHERIQQGRTAGRPGGGRPLCAPLVTVGVSVPGNALPTILRPARNSEPVRGPSRRPSSALQSIQRLNPLSWHSRACGTGRGAGGGPIMWHQWYLDDGAFLGPPDAVEALLGGLLPALGRLGCSVNRTKCQVWGPGVPQVPILSSFHQLDWREDGLTMLGVPIRRRGGSPRWPTALVEGFEASIHDPGRLPDRQI